MADHKKEQEREELHRTIWAIANDLRGSVDGWDFKQYVLGMLFYRYISENFTDYINQGEQEAGNEGFDYALLPDEDAEQAREDREHLCRLVPNSEIGEQDYNLSVSTYVEQEDTREVIDIAALNAEIQQIVAREQVLREEIEKIVGEIEGN